jgi:hypothetical protein
MAQFGVVRAEKVATSERKLQIPSSKFQESFERLERSWNLELGIWSFLSARPSL